MYFSQSTLLVILPLLAAQASALAVPEGGLVGRAQKGGKGASSSKGSTSKGGKATGAIAAGGAAGVAAGVAAGAIASNATANATAVGASASNVTATASNSTANATAGASGGDAQSSLTLDPAVIATGFEQNGQETPAAGQVASLTSSNNFINFCATTSQPITNGLQVKTGSCNPAPMGQIPGTTAMPSSKFTNPVNLQDIPANQAFTITMAINNMETGNFVNAEANYFAAPQQLNSAGQIVGHSHVVVEQLTSLTQSTPTDPNKFAFFKGLNDAAVGGVLSADVTAGLPAGTYKLSSINTAANHQPALVPIAQHGSLDDAVYFTVGGGGAGAANATSANATASAVTATASVASNATVAAGGASNSTAAGAEKGAIAGAAGVAAGVAAKGGKGASSAVPAASGAASKAPASTAIPKAPASTVAKGGAADSKQTPAAASTSGKGAKGDAGKGGKRRFIRELY